MKVLPFLFIILFNSCTTQRDNSSIHPKEPPTPIYTPAENNYGEITGIIQDENGEKMAFAKVVLMKGDSIYAGVTTDIEGNFKFKDVVADTYDLEVNYVGYSSYKLTGIKVKKGSIRLDKIELKSGVVLLKPIIYLYPEQETKVNVSLNYKGNLTHTYPTYPVQGWNVKASPNGTLWDEQGQEYYALFWEGTPEKPIIPQDGFVIPGDQTITFLEEKLRLLGLNRREANEFIMFWMPQMESNPYNFIHFSTKDYEDLCQLNITPKPETIIRIMMITKPLEEKINVPLQQLSDKTIERKGFTVVEWGGTIITQDLNL